MLEFPPLTEAEYIKLTWARKQLQQGLAITAQNANDIQELMLRDWIYKYKAKKKFDYVA